MGKLHGSMAAFTKQLMIIQNMPGRSKLLLLTYFGNSFIKSIILNKKLVSLIFSSFEYESCDPLES